MSHTIETPERLALVERMAALGPDFAKRAAGYDRTASFPHENWTDLKAAGLLGICIPEEDGGFGGDFIGYALASAELGRWCATTGLTFNMHVATTLLVGQISDDLDLDDVDRATVADRRSVLRAGVVNGHTIHSQPFSEGVAVGATEGFLTKATPVDGGFRVTGRKIFASLSGAADIHNIVCTVEGDPRIRFLGVAADAEGVRIEGDWDPLGMRGTDSRNLVLTDVFVPAENEWLTPGVFDQAARRWPYFYMTLSFSYLGLMRGILDHAGAYLRGQGGPSERRDHHIKQQGWAEMNLLYDRARSLCYDVLAESGPDPEFEALRRAWSSMVTTMNGAPEMAAIAIRICGGAQCCGPRIWSRRIVMPDAGPRCCPGVSRSVWSGLGGLACTPRATRHRVEPALIKLTADALVVLAGPSGAGKSTWASEWFRPSQIVSSDELRAVVGEHEHDLRASADSFDVLDLVVARRLSRGLLTVVDTLGMDDDRHAAWLALAAEHKRPTHLVLFDEDPKVCRKRNNARVAPVPSKVMSAQLKKWEEVRPSLREGLRADPPRRTGRRRAPASPDFGAVDGCSHTPRLRPADLGLRLGRR